MKDYKKIDNKAVFKCRASCITVLTETTTGGGKASFAMFDGYYSRRTTIVYQICKTARYRTDGMAVAEVTRKLPNS